MTKKRSPSQIARDRLIISGLYLQGHLQADIADHVGLSTATISNDLRAIRKKWLESTLVNFNEAKGRELAKIDMLERTYWEAWHRSLGVKERGQPLGVLKTITHYVGQGDEENPPQQQRMVVNSEEVIGDLACLQGIERCIAMRIKLFGLDEPQMIQVVDDDFDSEAWVAERDARHASALQALSLARGQGAVPQLEG